ncbi:MAG: Slp family lipoprotein [Pseudomonadota bacterium]|nr:Slp family lipoprotein [Pseudomonadota bacterium]
MNAIRLALPALSLLLLAACATQPGPLRGDYAPITPQDAVDHEATGAMVRWGGRVVQVEPQQGRTCFQVISTRLNSSGRPYHDSDDVGGRFIACRAGFYDPAVFEKNREVTFTGRIDGYESRKIGEYDYRFPRVDASVVYLWPVRERVDVIAHPMYPYYTPWWYW